MIKAYKLPERLVQLVESLFSSENRDNTFHSASYRVTKRRVYFPLPRFHTANLQVDLQFDFKKNAIILETDYTPTEEEDSGFVVKFMIYLDEPSIIAGDVTSIHSDVLYRERLVEILAWLLLLIHYDVEKYNAKHNAKEFSLDEKNELLRQE